MSAIRVRPADPEDAHLIHELIVELATYEREPDAVETTPELLRAQLAATPPPFECMIGELDEQPVGFALWFQTYSTWRGRPGLWLEDFYVRPSHRGSGVGRALFEAVERVASERGYGRLELSVLDWNELAIGFYRRRGGSPMEGWTTWRFIPGGD